MQAMNEGTGVRNQFAQGKQSAAMPSFSAIRQSRTQRLDALEGRLEELLVFEIKNEGPPEYKHFTVRSLYRYAMKAITAGKVEKDGKGFESPETRKAVVAEDAEKLLRTLALGNALLHQPSEQARPKGSSENEGGGNDDSGGEGEGPSYDDKNGSSSPGFRDDSKNIRPLQSIGESEVFGKSFVNRNSVSGGGGNTDENEEARLPGKDDKRLGSFLHPRDMRKLVTPFSASNEPELIVRRHAMLLNFDPLRAIILRDRLLILVPDGADSLLVELEERVRGGSNYQYQEVLRGAHGPNSAHGSTPSLQGLDQSKQGSDDGASSVVETEPEEQDDDLVLMQTLVDSEWQEMDDGDWIELPFELQSVDAVLHSVCNMLADDVEYLQMKASETIQTLVSPGSHLVDQAQEYLRDIKNEIQQMKNRVKGLNRALGLVLEDYEDMSLMNLSRLLTHPERYIQPVPQEILDEESDEPEYILESYLQQANSLSNALTLLEVQISSTEAFAGRKSDAIRNRLLYINMVISILSLCVTLASLVGSFFGMNVSNPEEDKPNAFSVIVISTTVGSVFLAIFLTVIVERIGELPGIFSKR
eukprot:CAMPEP_0119550220 /NCGR_PEP_ID=MMETSP1352-20130426/3765_1 /TAXON_ID=265584 /ORGANISM="Stauroneis constricta, Strain CCMP1120" /LENGTH=586 /DNA_ID=CAMNT_0007595993 /DNA_START=91 /DNA_END=1854 /DNA_ORIENTATION=+